MVELHEFVLANENYQIAIELRFGPNCDVL